ncbi:MAG: PD40 domain-containing protein [Planctomycetes bacterium]|nr:PD40 domain-containing protein [Planctomycetota bacterium]
MTVGGISQSVKKRAILAIVSLICSSAAFCPAADPAKTFEELFGADVKKASTSRNTRDAADFAVKLLENAQKVGDDPVLREYMLNKVCEFAMKDPSGFATAVHAVETLMKEFEAGKNVYADKLLGLYQTQYEKARGAEKVAAGEEYVNHILARGDELMEPVQPASQPAGPQINVETINAAIKFYRQAQVVAGAIKSSELAAQVAQKINEANGLIDLKKRYEDLVSRYAARPDDQVTAKALTLLCLLELDDPALALKYSSASGDEGLKIYVPLAAKPVKDVQESLCMELANWYKALAGSASGLQAKINALSRCKSYVAQFIALHTKSDGEQLKAQKMLEETGADLAKLDPAGKGGMLSKAVRLSLPKKAGIIWEYEVAYRPFRISLSPDCKKLAVCMYGDNGGYSVFDVETKKEIFQCNIGWSYGEAFTPDSKIFMATGPQMSVFEIKTGKVLVDKKPRADNAYDTPAFTPDGKYVYGFQPQDRAKTLDVVEVQTGKKVKQIPLDCKGTIGRGFVSLSQDGKLAAVSGVDQGEAAGKQRFCKIVDLAAEKPVQSLPCSQEGEGKLQVYLLSDGKRAIGDIFRVGLTIWDIRNGKVLAEFKKPAEGYAFTPDGKRLAFVSGFNVEVMDAASGKVIQTIKTEKPKEGNLVIPGACCFTPDGQYLFYGFCVYQNDYKEVKTAGAYLVGIGQ